MFLNSALVIFFSFLYGGAALGQLSLGDHVSQTLTGMNGQVDYQWEKNSDGNSICYAVQFRGSDLLKSEMSNPNSKECTDAMPSQTGYSLGKDKSGSSTCYRVDMQTQGNLFRQQVSMGRSECSGLWLQSCVSSLIPSWVKKLVAAQDAKPSH